MHDERKGMVLGFLGVTVFGLTLPATRFVVPFLDPMFVGAGRAALAGAVAAVLLAVARQQAPNRGQSGRLLVVASGVAVGFPLFSAWAMQSVSASHGGVVLGILPLATALAGALISSEKPSLGFWASSLIGSAIVVNYSLSGGVGTVGVGDLALLGAVVCAAVGYAVGGQLAKEMGGWQVICWALVISLPLILPTAWMLAPEGRDGIPVGVWWGVLYLSLGSQLLGFFLWNAGLAVGGVARVSQTQLLQPFVTVLASAYLLGETIGRNTLLTALLVFGVVAFGRTMPISKQPSRQSRMLDSQPMKEADQ